MNIIGKNIHVFGDISKSLPVVYLHTVRGEGHSVWEQCQKMSTSKFVLVEVDGVGKQKKSSMQRNDSLRVIRWQDYSPCGHEEDFRIQLLQA